MLHLSCLSFIIWLDAFVFQVVLFYFILFCFILWTASRFVVQLVLIWVVRKWILMRMLNESLARPHLSKKTILSPLTHGWMKNRHVSVFVEWLYHFGERFVFWQLPVDQFSNWHCSVIEIREGSFAPFNKGLSCSVDVDKRKQPKCLYVVWLDLIWANFPIGDCGKVVGSTSQVF